MQKERNFQDESPFVRLEQIITKLDGIPKLTQKGDDISEDIRSGIALGRRFLENTNDLENFVLSFLDSYHLMLSRKDISAELVKVKTHPIKIWLANIHRELYDIYTFPSFPMDQMISSVNFTPNPGVPQFLIPSSSSYLNRVVIFYTKLLHKHLIEAYKRDPKLTLQFLRKTYPKFEENANRAISKAKLFRVLGSALFFVPIWLCVTEIGVDINKLIQKPRQKKEWESDLEAFYAFLEGGVQTILQLSYGLRGISRGYRPKTLRSYGAYEKRLEIPQDLRLARIRNSIAHYSYNIRGNFTSFFDANGNLIKTLEYLDVSYLNFAIYFLMMLVDILIWRVFLDSDPQKELSEIMSEEELSEGKFEVIKGIRKGKKILGNMVRVLEKKIAGRRILHEKNP